MDYPTEKEPPKKHGMLKTREKMNNGTQTKKCNPSNDLQFLVPRDFSSPVWCRTHHSELHSNQSTTTDKAIQHVLHFCDDSLCEKKKVLAKK